jgi:hypothetical protein
MIQMPHVELFKRNRTVWGRLLSEYSFADTPHKGYDVEYNDGRFRCHLFPDGRLKIYMLSEYDFGSGGITVQDLGMIRASLYHDALCHMTDAGLLPYTERRRADNHFASLLWQTGSRGPIAAVSTAWRWTGVTLYSQTLARWRRKK